MKEVVSFGLSKDYDSFKILKGNRSIDRNKVKRFEVEFKEHKYLKDFPILVNENMEIIDGQHRFVACKNLGLPIVFKKTKNVYDIEEIARLNSLSTKWKSLDFINAYLDKPDYVWFKNFVEKFKIPAGVAIIVLRGDKSAGFHELNSGRLSLTEKEKTRAENIIYEIMQIKEIIPYADKFKFVAAYVSFRNKIVAELFYEKITKYSTLIKEGIKTSDYLKMFKKVYNYRSGNKTRINFGDKD